MNSILEEFAYGNIVPQIQTFKPDSAFAEVMGTLTRNEEKLLNKLEGEDKNLFQKYRDTQGELNQLTAVNNLIYGYKLGLLMTAEAFVTKDDLLTEDKIYNTSH